MALFIAIGHDAADSKERRPELRPAHLEHWKQREEKNQIVMAGPMTDFAGSVFILEADSIKDVEEWMRDDPYSLGGVFSRWEIHPFKATLPRSKYGES